MDLILLIIIILFSCLLFCGFLAWFLYLLYDTYITRRFYIRGYMISKSMDLRGIWLRKLEGKKGEYSLAKNKALGVFYYLTDDVFSSQNKYPALLLSEESFYALRIDNFIKTINIAGQRVLHPGSLKDILDNKLLAEITDSQVKAIEIITLIGVCVVLLVTFFLVFQHNQQTTILSSLQGNMTMLKEGLDMYSKVAIR